MTSLLGEHSCQIFQTRNYLALFLSLPNETFRSSCLRCRASLLLQRTECVTWELQTKRSFRRSRLNIYIQPVVYHHIYNHREGTFSSFLGPAVAPAGRDFPEGQIATQTKPPLKLPSHLTTRIITSWCQDMQLTYHCIIYVKQERPFLSPSKEEKSSHSHEIKI